MAIREFTFEPDAVADFIQFGYEVYRDDPLHVPPLPWDVRDQLSRRHPFHQRPGNHLRHFLATANGRTVGRISAMVNVDLKDRDGTPVATLGFFECIHDVTVAQELVDAAFGFLESVGAPSRVWAPMNFDIWHGYRTLSEGFDQPRRVGEPLGRPYYPELLERCGFTPRQHWYSVDYSAEQARRSLQTTDPARMKAVEAAGYRVRGFDMWNFKEELGHLHHVLTRSYAGFLGFTPISREEFIQKFSYLWIAMDPPIFTWLLNPKGERIGTAGALVDITRAVRALGGPLGKLRFAWHRLRGPKEALYHLGSLVPEERHSPLHIPRIVFEYGVRQMLDRGYQTIACTLMAEANTVMKMLGPDAKSTRRFTLYQRERKT